MPADGAAAHGDPPARRGPGDAQGRAASPLGADQGRRARTSWSPPPTPTPRPRSPSWRPATAAGSRSWSGWRRSAPRPGCAGSSSASPSRTPSQAAAEADAAEAAQPGSGDELARAGRSGKVKQLLLYLPVIHAATRPASTGTPTPPRAAARRRVPGRVPQPGQGHPGPAGRRRPRGTCAPAWPGRRCGSSSPPTCPPPSPATRWCCPTRRSCGSWPPGTTSAAAATWSSSPPSCAGTGSGARLSARPASTARSRPATCRAG